MYEKIGVAVAFSPNCEAIVAEAARLQDLFGADLYFIHIGGTTSEEKKYLENVIKSAKVDSAHVRMIWENGHTAGKILSVCKREGVDLLLAGALRKENLVKFYIGSIARRLLRKADCSVFTIIAPSNPPQKIKRVVINATDGINFQETVKTGIEWSKREGAEKVIIFKAIPLFGLSMAISGEEGSEKNYEDARRKIISEAHDEAKALLSQVDTGSLRVTIKIASGKPGFELKKCALKTKADLLVVKAPGHKLGLLDRLFPHYLEQVLWDLPCNLLIDKR